MPGRAGSHLRALPAPRSAGSHFRARPVPRRAVGHIRVQSQTNPTQPNKFTVKCSRQMLCPKSACAFKPMPIPTLNVTIAITYWGDSISAQMECDLRQWAHDANAATRIRSSHVLMGCPWICDLKCGPHLQRDSTHVIVFNVGAHYEDKPIHQLLGLLHVLTPIARRFVDDGGIFVVRSVSATHFDSPMGMYNYPNGSVVQSGGCVSHHCNDVAQIVVEQTEALKNFTNLTGGLYFDIYKQSCAGLHAEHATTHHGNSILDCRHFCSLCSVYRNWNAQLVDLVQQKKGYGAGHSPSAVRIRCT